jgi:hypothetical protein
MNDRDDVKSLPHNGNCTVNWFEEGGGDVYRLWDVLILFEVPQYGGKPSYVGTYPFSDQGIDDLLAITNRWT